MRVLVTADTAATAAMAAPDVALSKTTKIR
jgi:hypothetical protein